MTMIKQLTTQQAEVALDSLRQLLQNVVEDGASIGFIPPLDEEEARDYWMKIVPDLDHGYRLLFVALVEDQIVGSAQLALESRKNGLHRAEVQKVMVHTAYRGRGIGRQLMEVLEQAARTADRSLLVLDTRRGDVAEKLYQKLGYILAGIIPQYALSATGELHDTALYYRFI